MPTIRAAVLRAAGTNCDVETAHAWERVGAIAERVHIRRLIDEPGLLANYQVVTIPGGFSYGDDISAGKVFAVQLRRHLADALQEFVGADKLVLGICNGMQVLVKAGLLPDARRMKAEPILTITHNTRPVYVDRWVTLAARADTPCVFLEAGRRYELPMAHGEGRIVFRDSATREAFLETGQAALCYVAPEADGAAAALAVTAKPAGAATANESLLGGPALDAALSAYNPNGSEGDLAGICDPSGRVFGLMPHPERFLDWTQHPCWTSLPPREAGDGLAFFENALAYFR